MITTDILMYRGQGYSLKCLGFMVAITPAFKVGYGQKFLSLPHIADRL
jgi:hypothetical protein